MRRAGTFSFSLLIEYVNIRVVKRERKHPSSRVIIGTYFGNARERKAGKALYMHGLT